MPPQTRRCLDDEAAQQLCEEEKIVEQILSMIPKPGRRTECTAGAVDNPHGKRRKELHERISLPSDGLRSRAVSSTFAAASLSSCQQPLAGGDRGASHCWLQRAPGAVVAASTEDVPTDLWLQRASNEAAAPAASDLGGASAQQSWLQRMSSPDDKHVQDIDTTAASGRSQPNEARRVRPAAAAADSGEEFDQPPPLPPLSAEQQKVVELVVDRAESVFFTGCAGTGKTRTLHEIVERSAPKTTRVTAMTGVAACNLPGGTTLHSFAGVGLGTDPPDVIVQRIKNDSQKAAEWSRCQLLIVDEASMLSQELFELLEYVARKVRPGDREFGGIQLCLCGDFFQLPPATRGSASTRLCFESPLWSTCIDCCVELTTVYRQSDQALLKLLHEVRSNNISEASVELLRRLARPLQIHDSILPTRLLPVNSQVDRINHEHLARLPGEAREYRAIDQPPRASGQLTSLTNYPEYLQLKLGSQVMYLKNAGLLVNGSKGVVIDFIDCEQWKATLPVVRWRIGATTVVEPDQLMRHTQQGIITRLQLPLKLSWAMTIHKAQGMSIDFLEVDIASVFEKGQAYAALSRARTLEGLRVLGFDVTRFWTDARVVRFYNECVRSVHSYI
eukprot:TRINITY_DN21553_c0_g2_i2.p1 TRINITY_DN21553_c0_g2~~TRINITY_DN21553_c0_g2_i2.p1  ORF type:complete len:617 (-),score=127.56 TRINITY_DN21553_c0_g2_i2:277-2127(-)